MKKLDLHLFDGSLTVTVYADSGFSAASATPDSSLAKEDEVTLAWTLKSGKELAGIDVLAGGVTVDPDTKKFTMGESNVVISLKSKANNLYKVTEECMASVNDSKVVLHKNVVLKLTANGVPYDVEGDGTSVTVTPAIQNLIDTGVLVKI